MSSNGSQGNGPWYADGKFWVSPYNYAPEVRSQLHFASEMRIYDSTIRKILMSPTERITVKEALDLAGMLREAGVRYMCLNVFWWGGKEPEPLAYQIVGEILKRFDFEATVYLDDMSAPEWEKRLDVVLAMGAKTIGVYLNTSDLQMSLPTAQSKEWVLERLEATVNYIKKGGAKPIACVQDGARTELEWLATYLRRGIELGEARIDLCDSPGTTSPEAMKFFVTTVRAQLRPPVPMVMHIHKDLGLADAGVLAAATVGCWPDCSINGVSYRAGFASLQNVVAALEILYGVPTGIDMTKFAKLSKVVADHTYPIQPHQAITGDHAFVKEIPGSVAAALAGGDRYFPPVDSPISPEMFGAKTHIVWARQTLAGKALQVKLQKLGLDASPESVERVRKVLIEKRTKMHDYPRWVEDEEVDAICRELVK